MTDDRSAPMVTGEDLVDAFKISVGQRAPNYHWQEMADALNARLAARTPGSPAAAGELDRATGRAVYIAARFSRRPEANALAQRLKALGFTITSRWVKPDCDHVLPTGLSRQAEDSERARFAAEDVDDVRAADIMVSLMEEPRSNGRGGRHVEFGIGLALGKRMLAIGPRETVFHHLPGVECFDDVEATIAALVTPAGRE